MNPRTPLVTVALLALLFAGCETAPKSEAKKATLEDEAMAALNRLKRTDPSLADLLDRSYGYVIFPNVGKGGVIVGGAYGKGVVYEQGRQVGYADLTQATIGAQLGGQTFTELLVFENKQAMDRFKNNQLAFTANASAVAISAGAAKAARFENGVAVFVQPNGGLMFEASVGGQKFTFVPIEGAGPSTQRGT
jgi:lipid-binding SYLF domain-containing protein